MKQQVKRHFCVLKPIFFIGLLLCCFFSAAGQGTKINRQNDSLALSKKNYLVLQSINGRQYEKAIVLAKNTAQSAEEGQFVNEQAMSELYLGKAYRQKKDYFEALKHLLKALRLFEDIYQSEQLAETTTEVAIVFQEQKAYLKASEYFNNAYNLYKKLNQTRKANQVLENLARIQMMQGDKENAYKNFASLAESNKNNRDSLSVLFTLNRLGEIATQQNNLQVASQHFLEILKLYGKSSQIAMLTSVYNNLGVISKKLGNKEQSIGYFNQSLNLYQKNKTRLPDSLHTQLLENVGVAYTNLGEYNIAGDFFKNALKIKQKGNNKAEIAKTFNYIAANFYISGNQSKAVESVNQAIILANDADADDALMTSYRILSLVYKNDNSYKAQEFAEQANRIAASIKEKQQYEAQKTLANNTYLEKLENDLKQQILAEEQSALRIRRLAVEADEQKREKEKQLEENRRKEDAIKIQLQQIDILKNQERLREIALQNERLEGEKSLQLLDILRQKSNNEQQRQRLKISELEIQNRKDEEARQKQLIDEQNRKIQDASRLQRYGIAIIVLGALFSFAVGLGMYFTFINNQKLRSNNKKIQEQGKAIEDKNNALNQQNNKISESIRAARTIQQAMLPKDEFISNFLYDYFILYRPKDVVSGDFYWVERIYNRLIISAVDCTGHGVPGAFMSVIGFNLLDKITEKLHILDPDIILNSLDQEVRESLQVNKEGNLGENDAGMDIGICVIEQGSDIDTFQISYSGAGRPMYYFDSKQRQIMELNGDKKSIGVFKKKTPNFAYTKKTVTLHSNDCIYLCSDGYGDQNNAAKDKIGSETLKKLLASNVALPMAEQKNVLENYLTNFCKDEPQRDDILVIGMRL